MLLRYGGFTLQIFRLNVHTRHFCCKILCFDADGGKKFSFTRLYGKIGLGKSNLFFSGISVLCDQITGVAGK